MSAEEAWESYQEEYFADMPELAEGFAEDNPLANSASYEIYLNHIEDQDEFVEYLESIDGIRRVNYSETAAEGLSGISRVVGYVSAGLILILLGVSVFLISNTVSMAITVRKEEIKIMRLIGATDFLIRAPFVVEGMMIGLVGAAIPLAAMYFLYLNTVEYVTEKFRLLSGLIRFLPVGQVYPEMAAISLALGGGLGFIVSFMTIRKHLRV